MLFLREQELSPSTLLQHPHKSVRWFCFSRVFLCFLLLILLLFSMITTVTSGVVMFAPIHLGLLYISIQGNIK